MIVVALALFAQTTALQIQPLRADNPTAADKAVLKQIATKCGLREGEVYFVQYNIPLEPVIHMATGLDQSREMCVLQSLPSDFSSRFGFDTQPMPKN